MRLLIPVSALLTILLPIPVTALAQQAASAPQPPAPPASAPASRPVFDPTRGYHLEKGPYAVGEVKEMQLEDTARNKKKLPIKIRYPKFAPSAAVNRNDDAALDAKTAARAKKRDEPSTIPAALPSKQQPAVQPTSATASQPASAAGEPRRFPLIIFSHGAGGSSEAFDALSEHWASHGYIVIHPTHSDSLKLRRAQGEDLSGLRDNPQRLRTDVKPMDRLADKSLILASLDLIEQRVDALHDEHGRGRIDRDRIGMAGHSAGAYTTQLAAGVKVRGLRLGAAKNEMRSHFDTRIKATILISGQGLTNASFTRESWNALSRPMMVFAGSLDTSKISNETPASRRDPFEYAPPGDKYLVFIEGATHGSYQGGGLAEFLGEKPTSDIDMITSAVASGTLAFWDAYLKGADGGKAYLQSDKLMEMSGGQAQLSRK